jgi:hypothetical protein
MKERSMAHPTHNADVLLVSINLAHAHGAKPVHCGTLEVPVSRGRPATIRPASPAGTHARRTQPRTQSAHASVAHPSNRHRELPHGRRAWGVIDRGEKYEVTNDAHGMRIKHRGETVWTGIRCSAGAYKTKETVFAPARVDELLKIVRAGDEAQEAIHHVKPPPPGAVAVHTPEGAPGSHHRQRKPTSKPKGEPKPRKAAKRAAPSRPPASKKPASKKPPSSKRAVPSKPRARVKPASKKPARARAPATQRAPGVAAPMTDKQVLAEVHERLRKEDPANANAMYKDLAHIWRAGGKAKAKAWAKSHHFASLVDAFNDWVLKHVEQAQGLLAKKVRGRPAAA